VLAAPRACHLLRQVSVADRDDCWLADVNPPFPGKTFDFGIDDVSRVIIASKWQGASLFDNRGDPIPVYVVRVLGQRDVSSRLESDQVALMLWGFLSTRSMDVEGGGGA